MITKLICWIWRHQYWRDVTTFISEDGDQWRKDRIHYKYCQRCGKRFVNEGNPN